MTKEESEKFLREQLGDLDDDDKEVAAANSSFEETYEKIRLLL